MKIDYDKNGRKIYKFSHSVAKGGNVYMHQCVYGKTIKNKQGLRNVLCAIARKFRLIDFNIKIYDSTFFFFFFVPRSLAPAELIGSIHKNISPYGELDRDYVYTGVYDLQEKYLKKDLEKWGFDYDKG